MCITVSPLVDIHSSHPVDAHKSSFERNKTIASRLHYPEMSNNAPKIIVTKQKNTAMPFFCIFKRPKKLGHLTVHSPAVVCV